MFSGPVLGKEGWRICQNDGPVVEACLVTMLNCRMRKGHTVVVDSTHSRENALKRYADHIQHFGYRASYIDFRDVPLETCLRRNALRIHLYKVPEDVIRDQHEFLSRLKIPPIWEATTVEEVRARMFAAGDYRYPESEFKDG
jgi:predicted kinase